MKALLQFLLKISKVILLFPAKFILRSVKGAKSVKTRATDGLVSISINFKLNIK